MSYNYLFDVIDIFVDMYDISEDAKYRLLDIASKRQHIADSYLLSDLHLRNEHNITPCMREEPGNKVIIDNCSVIKSNESIIKISEVAIEYEKKKLGKIYDEFKKFDMKIQSMIYELYYERRAAKKEDFIGEGLLTMYISKFRGTILSKLKED